MSKKLQDAVERTLLIIMDVSKKECESWIDVTVEKTKASFQDLLTKIDTGNQNMIKE